MDHLESSEVNLKVIAGLRFCVLSLAITCFLLFLLYVYQVCWYCIITLTLNGFTDVWRSLDTHLGP